MARYTYQPLHGSGKEARIRLLALLPDSKSGTPPPPLRCSISNVSISALLPFEALSYTWGDEPAQAELEILGGGSLHIKKNLHEALVHLRLEDQPRLLWVDAICIDQESNTDKNQQIPLMRQIYQNAREVVIWLGKASETTDAALALIPLTLRAVDEDAAAGRQRNLALAYERPDYFPSVADPRWGHLRTVLERPWFHRAWIVQEAAVARKATIMHGDSLIDLDDLLKAIMYLVRSNLQILLFGGVVEIGRLLGLVSTRAAFARQKAMPSPLALFLQQKGSLSSEPRDKIFAFHGLFEPGSFGAVVSRPDYDLTCAEVYTRVAVELLKKSRNLDILSVPRPPSPTAKLPTWVPDWGADLCATLILTQVSDVPGHQPLFRASGDSVYDPIFLEGDTKLLLKGHVFDTIHLITPRFEVPQQLLYEEALKAPEKNAVANLRVMWSFESVAFKAVPGVDIMRYPRTGEFQSEAYWQTLLGGCNERLKPVMARAMSEYWAEMLPIRERVLRGEDAESLVLAFAAEHMKKSAKMYETNPEAYAKTAFVDPMQTVFKMARGFYAFRSMFKTKTGYIGLAPQDAQVGDRVAIVQGGKLPVVIRPRRRGNGGNAEDEREWELVGESYVHGTTDGSLWAELGAEKGAQDIVLA